MGLVFDEVQLLAPQSIEPIQPQDHDRVSLHLRLHTDEVLIASRSARTATTTRDAP